jgi:hypothetical protein
MEILLILLRVVIFLVTGAAAIEPLAALFSKRVRQYIMRRPILHVLWFAFALLLALLLIPAYSTRNGGF